MTHGPEPCCICGNPNHPAICGPCRIEATFHAAERRRTEGADTVDTVNIAPSWRETARICAAILESGTTAAGRRTALETLDQMAQLADAQAAAVKAGAAALKAGRPVIWIHGRPYADPGAADA